MKSSSQNPKQKVGSGRNITKINERIYKRGSLMFIEGELSSEMFIIRSGKIRILKQEGDKTVELAVLGPGSVLGELSLLDHQPRSATAQVVEDLKVTIIDEKMFDQTMKAIPNWLANIIQVVVTRLRETMIKTSDSIVQKSVAGVVNIILLLYKNESIELEGEQRIPMNRAKEAISSTIGLGDIETENVFMHLILKEMMYVRKDEAGKEFIILIDYDVFQLYMNFLRAAQRGISMLGENLSEPAVDLTQTIIDTGEKNGKIVKPGIKKIGVTQIEVELQRQGKGQHINLDALDALLEAKVVFKEQDAVKTSHQTHKRIVLVYNENTLKKIVTLHVWLAKFKEEVKF